MKPSDGQILANAYSRGVTREQQERIEQLNKLPHTKEALISVFDEESLRAMVKSLSLARIVRSAAHEMFMRRECETDHADVLRRQIKSLDKLEGFLPEP